MTDQLTKAVKTLNYMHKSANEGFMTFVSLVQNPKHFPKVATAVVLSSGLLGFGLMQIVNVKRDVRER